MSVPKKACPKSFVATTTTSPFINSICLMKGQLQSSKQEIRSLRKRKEGVDRRKTGHHKTTVSILSVVKGWIELWPSCEAPDFILQYEKPKLTWGSPTARKRNWGETLAAETGNTTAKIDKMGNSISWWKMCWYRPTLWMATEFIYQAKIHINSKKKHEGW